MQNKPGIGKCFYDKIEEDQAFTFLIWYIRHHECAVIQAFQRPDPVKTAHSREQNNRTTTPHVSIPVIHRMQKHNS